VPKLSELYRQKRELLADMKEAGIKRMSCMNRQDDQSFRCNLLLQELDINIRKEKLANKKGTPCPTPT